MGGCWQTAPFLQPGRLVRLWDAYLCACGMPSSLPCSKLLPCCTSLTNSLVAQACRLGLDKRERALPLCYMCSSWSTARPINHPFVVLIHTRLFPGGIVDAVAGSLAWPHAHERQHVERGRVHGQTAVHATEFWRAECACMH